VRSRVRRVLREAYRQVAKQVTIKTGFLVVIAARGAMTDMKSPQVASELRYALQKIGLLQT
ncbi:MAG: ribonuclease P protein component, partial [Eubacteriales bacterium]